MERPDEELMRGVASGDPGALEALYDRHAPTMLALGRRMLGRTGEAEDAVNDVLWNVWDRPEGYDTNRGTVRTYLLLRMRSRCLDRLRRRRIHRGDASGVESDRPTPEAAAQTQENAQTIHRAIAGLSDKQRVAIELAFYEGLSHSEIADRTGEPLGTIKSRVRLGLIRLRDELRNLDEGGNDA